MLDWLKFFPFVWSVDHNPTEVRGPYFSKLRHKRWPIGDCTLNFRAPWSHPMLALSGREYSRVDSIPFRKGAVERTFRRDARQAFAGAIECDSEVIYRNEWFFVGPWFTGQRAFSSFSGVLVTTRRNPQYDINLFHPRVFEAAVASYLDERYGLHVHEGEASFRGPLNWKRLPVSSSVQGVQCDVHQVDIQPKENPYLRRFAFMPIDPHRFVVLCYNFGDTEVYNPRHQVWAKPQFELCDAIFDSVRLEVGEKAQAEWEKVKATCPDMSLSETMGEFKWPLNNEEPRNAASEVDITPKGKAGFLEDAS